MRPRGTRFRLSGTAGASSTAVAAAAGIIAALGGIFVPLCTSHIICGKGQPTPLTGSVTIQTTQAPPSTTSPIKTKPPASPTYQQLVTDDGPLAWWRFDDSSDVRSGDPATDTEGRYNGTYYVVTPMLGSDGPVRRRADHAAYFDGTDNSIGLPAGLALNSDFTIEVWVKLATDGKATDAIVGPGGGASGPDLNFFDGRLRLWTGQVDAVVAESRATPGRWIYWVVTRSLDRLLVYRDGSIDASPGTWSGNFPLAAIGIGNDNSEGLLHGWLAELAVYDKALTQTDVLAHCGAARAAGVTCG